MSWFALRPSLFIAFGVSLVGLATARPAAEESATGVWAWTFSRNGLKVEAIVELKQQGERLTGILHGARGYACEILNGQIGGDGEFSFTVERVWDGKPLVIRYRGKLVGDSIRGKVETTRNGVSVGRAWEARRIADQSAPLLEPSPTRTTGRAGLFPVVFL